MSTAMNEKGYEKNAWMLLAILAVVGLIFAILLILEVPLDPSFLQGQLGQSVSSFSASNPKAYSAILSTARDAGAALLGFSIAGIGISITAFRRGERWAWYVFLYLPIYLLYVTVETYAFGGVNWPLYAVFVLVSLAALLLPYRKFFPRK